MTTAGHDDPDRREPHEMPREKDTGGQERPVSPVSEVSALARHRDASRRDPSRRDSGCRAGAGEPAGVAWVRPTELFAATGGRVAGRGISFQAELARRTRRLPVQTVATSRRATSRRSARLSPVSAFGSSRTPASSVSRTGLGLR